MLIPTSNKITLASIGNSVAQSIELNLTAIAPATEWQSYYHRCDGMQSLIPTKVVIGSSQLVPTIVGPSNVMSYTLPSDGVWHPDSLIPEMWWSGGNFGPDHCSNYILPFGKVLTQATVHFFTETLPAAFTSMQWAMPIYGACVSADRGNYTLANQDTRPGWLSTPEFLAFGALRAYPNQQMRKLCIVLHNRSLPFHHVQFYLFTSD